MSLFLWIVIFITLFWIVLIISFSKKSKLDRDFKNKVEQKIKKIKKINSSKELIIDYDKIYHGILQNLGYSWTFWEILKSKPKIIDDLNKIWELHKLRNKLVHDFDLLEEDFLRKKAREYEKIVMNLLKKV